MLAALESSTKTEKNIRKNKYVWNWKIKKGLSLAASQNTSHDAYVLMAAPSTTSREFCDWCCGRCNEQGVRGRSSWARCHCWGPFRLEQY